MTRPALMPADTPDYMAPAWAACMSFALGNAEMRAAFEAETGMTYSPPKDRFTAMIDDATGFGRSYVEAFVKWANVKVWGPVDDPESLP